MCYTNVPRAVFELNETINKDSIHSSLQLHISLESVRGLQVQTNTFFKTTQRPRFLNEGLFIIIIINITRKKVSSLELDNGTLSFCSVIVLKSHPFHHKPWNDHHHH